MFSVLRFTFFFIYYETRVLSIIFNLISAVIIILENKLQTKLILISSLGAIVSISIAIMTYCFCKRFARRQCYRHTKHYSVLYNSEKDAVAIRAFSNNNRLNGEEDNDTTNSFKKYFNNKSKRLENEYHWGELSSSSFFLYRDVDGKRF